MVAAVGQIEDLEEHHLAAGDGDIAVGREAVTRCGVYDVVDIRFLRLLAWVD